MNSQQQPKQGMRTAMGVAIFVFLPYLAAITIFGKGPTYLSVMGIYWGEITMLLLLVWMGWRLFCRRLPAGMTSLLGKLIIAYMLLGGALMLRSIGHWPLLDVVRDSAIWYYGTFFFIGIYLATLPAQANRLWKALAWIWLGALVWATFAKLGGRDALPDWLNPEIPDRGVTLLSSSGNENEMHAALAAALLLLGLPRLGESRVGKLLVALLACMAVGVLLIANGRGVKIAVMCAAMAGVIATFQHRRSIWPMSRVFIPGFVLVSLLITATIVLEPQDLAKAGKVSRFEELAESDSSGTAYWRLIWWENILQEVNAKNPAIGLGFGRNLADLNPLIHQESRTAWPVRAPHNFNVTVLGRMGYIGLAFWTVLLAVGLGQLYFRVRGGGYKGRQYTAERHKELVFWLMMLVATWVNSSLGVLMEGPVLGIWFWFALGFATGRSMGPDGLVMPAVQPAKDLHENFAPSQ